MSFNSTLQYLRRPVTIPKPGLQAVKNVAELWLEQRYFPLVDFVNLVPCCRVVRFNVDVCALQVSCVIVSSSRWLFSLSPFFRD